MNIFLVAIVFIALVIFMKWAAARLLFQLPLLRSVVLALSPFAYLPGIVYLLFATWNVSLRYSDIFYDDAGDGRELLGISVVFLAAFTMGFAAMSLLDWGMVRGARRLLAIGVLIDGKAASRSQVAWGGFLVTLANLMMWLFWVLAYYAIQFPPELDFDG